MLSYLLIIACIATLAALAVWAIRGIRNYDRELMHEDNDEHLE